MDVLPDHAGDRHPSHKAHHHDPLAFHQEENVQRSTSNVECGRCFSELEVRRWAFSVCCGHWNVFTAAAGFPATMVFGGILFVTTAPAATTELSPMVTPFKIIAPIP